MEEKHVVMTVQKVTEAEGRDGPQWELQVMWPWSKDFPDKVWLDQSAFDFKPEIRAYNVAVKQTTHKKKQGGGFHDGTYDWMWNYKVLDFEVRELKDAPPKTSHNDTTPPGHAPASTDQREVGIRRSVALKAAVEWYGPNGEESPRNVIDTAELFDGWLKQGLDLHKLDEALKQQPRKQSQQPRKQSQQPVQEAMETGEGDGPPREHNE